MMDPCVAFKSYLTFLRHNVVGPLLAKLFILVLNEMNIAKITFLFELLGFFFNEVMHVVNTKYLILDSLGIVKTPS